jgi:hypothetical protein
MIYLKSKIFQFSMCLPSNIFIKIYYFKCLKSVTRHSLTKFYFFIYLNSIWALISITFYFILFCLKLIEYKTIMKRNYLIFRKTRTTKGASWHYIIYCVTSLVEEDTIIYIMNYIYLYIGLDLYKWISNYFDPLNNLIMYKRPSSLW